MEAPPRFELGIKVLQTSALPLGYGAIWSGRRDSNPRPSPWQGDTLPLSHFRIFSGAQRRNRTTDTGIFSPLLYRLSYLGKHYFYSIRQIKIIVKYFSIFKRFFRNFFYKVCKMNYTIKTYFCKIFIIFQTNIKAKYTFNNIQKFYFSFG